MILTFFSFFLIGILFFSTQEEIIDVRSLIPYSVDPHILLVLPDWNPIRVAEDIALLDQLTRGRVDFGVARGLNSRCTIQFSPEADRRDELVNRALFKEVLDIVLEAWTQESFSYKGEFFNYPVPGWKETNPLERDSRFHSENGELIALGITPNTYQKPHPPVYNMVESVNSHVFSAQQGIAAMCFSLSVGRIKEAWNAYREIASSTPSRNINNQNNLAIMRPTYLADTYEQAVADARLGTNLLGDWSSNQPHKARRAMVSEDELVEDDLNLDWFDFQIKHDQILVGSPDSVTEQIDRIRAETGCEHLAFFLNIPKLSFDQVMHSLDLMSTHVIPRFQ